MDVATTTVGLTDLKFRLVREDFADAVAWVARNLPTRPDRAGARRRAADRLRRRV